MFSIRFFVIFMMPLARCYAADTGYAAANGQRGTKASALP